MDFKILASLQPFAISFLIGLFIGIERERSHPLGHEAMGVRTFILLAMLGTLSAWIPQPIITIAIAAFAVIAILLGYLRSTATLSKNKKTNIGLTTEFSAAVVFCLGFITPNNSLLAVILGIAVLLVLLGRKRLHQISHSHLKPEEVQTASLILVIMLGILPFLPNYPIDPWQLFNPYRFWLLVVIIALIQFSGYVAVRVFGERLGMVLMGFFGGLVSSTAVFVNLPRLIKKNPRLFRHAAAAAILATVAMLIEFIVIVAVAAPQLVIDVIWPIVAMMTTGTIIALLIIYGTSQEKLAAHSINPLDFKSVLRLACLIGGMIFLIGLTKQYMGLEGLRLVAFLGGLFELHSTTYAIATVYFTQNLSLHEAIVALSLAVFAGFFAKFILLWGLARDKFAMLTSIVLVIMMGSGLLVYYYT